MEASAPYCGLQQVTVATREGIVIVKGEVELHPRRSDTPASARYDYRQATHAATVLQARQRGRAARQLLRREGAAATTLSKSEVQPHRTSPGRAPQQQLRSGNASQGVAPPGAPQPRGAQGRSASGR